MSPRLCFALVAAVCCAVLAVATPAQEVPFDSLGFSVEFVKAVYHHRTDSTEFIYTVTSGSNTLSHWVLSPGCELDLYHPDDQDWLPYAVDQTTGATGYEALGQDAGTVHTVSIVFEGAVGVTPSATNDFTVKSGLKYAKGSVRGPLCNGGSIKTAGLCDQINDTTVSCPYVAVAGDYGQSSYTIDTAAGRCPNEKQYTISYLFNQADGVCEECVQVITVEDKTAPKITGIPKGQEYIQLSCNDPEPELPTGVVAHDDCQDGDITPNYCNKRNNGSCPNNYFLLRSWTATDECGNSECVTQTIAYLDETAPEFHGLPNNEVVECNISAGPIELTDNVTVSDHGCDCFVNPSKPVSYSSTTYPGECPNTYETIRTWTATDCCQNVAKATRKFIVKDTTAPELKLKNESLSANATFQCNAVPAAYEVVAADNCMGQAPVVTYTDKNHTGSCIGSYTIERLYTACDDCGNTGHLPSWWVIDDSIPPFWTSKPQNASNECGSHGKVTAPEASDSCSPIKNNTITYNDTIPGDCPNEFTIVHVWTAYDDCGNSVTHSYQEAVYDTTPVKIDPKSIPDLGPYNCAEDVPSLESILANIKPLACEGAHCACEQTFDRSATEVNTTDGCTNRVTIVRTYTFTDKCGNNDTVTKTIYVNDKNGPNLYGNAPDGEILCNQVAEVPTITKCDDCDACDCSESACRTPVEREEKNETTSCPYIWTIKRNWTAVDECGNPSTKLQTITVVNPDVPRFIDPPPNKEVQCGDVPVKPNLTAVMNCTSVTVDNSIPDETEGSVCDGSYKIIRKWKATDDSCGKVTWYTQNITVIDTVDPVITGVPDDADYPCNEVPAPPAVCASDNCVGLSLKYSEVRNNYSTCGQPDQFVYELIRTWNATDKCGNQVIKQQKIRVYDRVNPTVGTQDNLEFNCTDVQIPADPTYGDACTTAHLDRFHYRVNSTECDESYVLYRNFRVSDDCGNTVWLNYTITVTDVEAPTFTIPPNRRDRCEPVREDATNLDDNCDENIAFTADSPKEENSTVCLNEYNISRTWTATDDCGKTTTKTQLIEVYNDVHPEFDGTLPPTELHEQCDAPAAPKLTAKDGCGHVIPVEEIFTNTTQGCRHRYIANRTYVATDDCGLATVFTQLVYVNDTTKPELVGVPANTTAKCGPEKPASVCAKDSCDGVTINYTQEIIPNPTAPCANRYTVVRTWTATDDCGNTHSESQYIEVNDDVDPVFDSQPPADDYATCTHVAPQKPTATDNCKTVEVTDHSYRVNGSCEQNYEWHVAFLATDACGNTAWWNYTIFVSDIHAPVIDRWDGDNSDQNFTCGNEPARPTPVISDNCNTGHVEDLPDERVNGTCEDLYTVVRRWRIYDDCENSYVVNQTITGVHPDAPHFTQFPVDENVESCTGTPSPVDPPAFDMCGRPLDVTPNTQNTTDDQKCIYNFDEFRTWTASKCGLSTTINQTIHWRDNTKPVFDEPSDQTLNKQCTYPDPATPSANDTCDPNPTVQGPTVVESDRTCKYRFTNTYTWNATDACGNVQYADQQIKYTWNNAAPSIDKPILKPSYKCVPPTRPEVNATDFCGVPLYVEPSEKRVNHSCPEFEYTLTWRWNTTDDCGETAEWEQTFEITNPDNPTLHGVPPHTTAECGFIPKPAHVTGTAGCGGPVNVTSYDDIIEGASCCNYTIVRTYSGVDICGRVTNETQIITVVDTIPPRLHGVPSDRSEPCPWTPDQVNVTGEEPPLAVGYCANADYTVDSCGNPATATAFVVGGNTLSVAGTVFAEYLNGQAFFDIKVTDGSAFGVGELEFGGLKYLNEFNPVYSPPAELDPSCYGNGANQVSPSQWNYYTQAVGWLYFNNVNYTLVEDSTTPSQVGTGANGLSKEYGASLYLKSGSDSVLIRLDFSGNGFDGCTIDETDWPELKCGEPILVNVTNTTIPGSCDQNYKFVRTWCAYDKVGNHICANQTVTVYDSADPVISGLPDSAIDANCSGPIPPPVVPTVTDCDPNVEWHNTTRKIESGVCDGKYTLQYWYNATDDCGNKASAYYEVHVNDNEDPTITGVPDKTVQLQCNDSLAPAIATASDNCGINTTAYPVVSNDDADEAGEQACDQSFKRTYTYTAIDDCGRQTQAHYTISVRDDVKPEVVNVPGNATLECKDAFPGHSAQAKDVCDLTPDLNVSISWYNTSCAGKYQAQRTFQAKDECGNLSPMYYQWITWQDTKKPYFTGGLPTKNETVQCGQTLPIPTPTAADACEGPITPTLKNWTTGATCKDRVFWYEWTIEDCSGNKDSFVWTVTVVDTVNPTITPAGSDVNAVGCTIPLPPAVCATDNCPGVTLDYEETKYCTDANYPCTGDKSCARYRLFREWVATDSCGNKNNTSYNVFVNDTTAPTCTWTAPPATIPCNASLTVDQPVCSDDCSGYKIEDFSTNSDSSCITNGVRNIAFKVSDYCGNFKWFNSTVTFVDTIGPVITGDFSDVNVTCPNAVPPYTPSVSDQCDGSVQLGTPTEVITPNAACAPLVTVTRTYWAKDKCGNWAQNKTKTWHVIDTTAPTFDQPMPQNVTVNCSEIPNVPEGFTATDSCLGKVPVLYGDYQIPGSCPNNYQIVRLWNASDCAGNVVKHVQVITVVDQINPVITFTPPLADREETCKGDFSVPSACASDNCDGVNVTYSNKKDQPVAGCDKYTITRTWVATDACGNKSPEYKYTITVNDTVAPECPTVSDDSTTCDLPNAKDPSAPTCTDDCSTVKYSAYNDSKAGDCLDNYDKLFSFLAYDGCGNPTWRNITIHVTDTSAPTFTNPPADETINCTEAANYPVPDVNATDNCDTTVKPVFVPVSNGFEQGKCANYTIVRRWTLKDRCGNPAADHTQTITVQDVVAPSFIGPLPTNLTLRCNDTREQPELSAEDNCGTAGVQKYSREVSRDCDGNYTVEWKWVATDLCGLTTEHIVYVTYYDNVKPTMTDVEPEINATCGQVPKPPQVCCNDECGGLSMNFHVTRVNGSCDSRYTLHRTWTCTDDCGNQETREQTVKVGDDTPPEFVEPLPNKTVTYECTIEGPPNVTAIDDCTGLTIANLTTEVHQGGCDANYTVIRTYTAYDQCGVAQQYNQTVEVRDTQPPTTCGGFECRLKYSYGQFLKIPEITVPNAYFCANDSCSSVNITLISCVSNQDEVLNATTTLPGFTNQCDYKPDQDALYISGLIDTTDALGRMYVITALIQDQCGHSVTTTREVFIPLDAGSFVKRNLSELLSDECTSIPIDCPDSCPCQTVDHYCADTNAVDLGTLKDPVVTTDGEFTTFKWELVTTADRPTRIAIGLDLTKIQFISASPDANVRIGEVDGSLLTGVFWLSTHVTSDIYYSITVKGAVTAGELVPYQMGGLQSRQDDVPSACNPYNSVKGIASVDVTPDAIYDGVVQIVGAFGGEARNLSVPLKDVIVNLINNNTREVLASVMTDEFGAYSFPGWAANPEHHVILSSTDGFLRPGRSSNIFLIPQTTNAFLDDKWGVSQPAGDNVNFGLLLKPNAQPVYNRPASSVGFEGNSYLSPFWRYQYILPLSPGVNFNKKAEFPQDLLNYWSGAADLLAPCADAGFFEAPGSLKHELRAAALNLVSGRGPFDPYREAAAWFVAYADLACGFSSSSADATIALNLVNLVNQADDLD